MTGTSQRKNEKQRPTAPALERCPLPTSNPVVTTASYAAIPEVGGYFTRYPPISLLEFNTGEKARFEADRRDLAEALNRPERPLPGTSGTAFGAESEPPKTPPEGLEAPSAGAGRKASDRFAVEHLVLPDGTPMDRIVFQLATGDTTSSVLPAFMELADQYAHRLISAPMAGGKTHLLTLWRARLPGRVTGIVNRVGLCRTLAERFNGYSADKVTVESDLDGRRRVAEDDTVFIPLQGLTAKGALRDAKDHHIIVDEVQSVIETLCMGDELRGTHRSVTAEAFERLLRRSASVTYAQANITDAARGWLARMAQRMQQILLEIVIETHQSRGRVHPVATAEDLNERALAVAKSGGSFAYAATDRGEAEAMQRAFRGVGRESLLVTGDTTTVAEVRAWMRRPNDNPPSILIYNTAVGAGVSIDTRDDGKPRYPTLFVNVRPRPGGVSCDDVLQLIGRVRGTPKTYVYAPSAVWSAVSPDTFAQVLEVKRHYADTDARWRS